MQDITSEFKLYSVGRVVENKALDSDIIEVALIEMTPAMSGELKADPTRLESKGQGADGSQYTSGTTTDTNIHAKWLPWGSNRITPPDVRRDERVLLYRFADEEDLYWVPAGLDSHLRRLETVVFGINGNPNGLGDEKPSPKNMYTFEWSTHTKQMTIRTSKANGEPVAYVIQLNTDKAGFTITDDLNNIVQLNSQEAIILLKNSFGSFFQIEKNTIDAFAAESIHLKTEVFHLEANTVKIDCTQYTATTQNYTVQCPSSIFTGDVKVGNISTGVQGNNSGMVSQGNLIIKGDLETTGNATIGGKITCAGVDSSANVNAPNIK